VAACNESCPHGTNSIKVKRRFDPHFNFKEIRLAILDKIPYSILIVFAVFMLLAPFRPMPHVIEKLIMLKNGTLTKPIDIFDLFYHLVPIVVLALKVYRDYTK
jgi:hypothetical protein